MKKIYLISLLSLLLISCSTDDESNPNNNQEPVNTSNATIGNFGGVTLYGKIESDSNDIVDVGFEYASDSLMTNNKILVSAKSTLNKNEFNYLISTGIKKNFKYFYKAFIQNNNNYYYGETKSFISDGSVAPEIISIANDFGHIADTLEIFGKYFKDINYSTSVNFSNTNATIISLNDTIIKCIVPTYLNKISTDISVRIDNRSDTYASFNLYAPIISAIEPLVGTIGDTISINGDHYDLVDLRNSVYFGNIKAKIIKAERNSLKVIVPTEIKNPTEKIKLNAQLQEVIHNQDFTLAKPIITSISPLKATFRDEITIKGENFDFAISRNKVYFGSVEATITYADKNTLKVMVPDNLEKSSEYIKVEAQLQEAISKETFQLIPPEISFVPKGVFANQVIKIQGAFFHPVSNRNIITIEDIKVTITSGNSESLNTKIPSGPFPRRKASVKIELLDLITVYEVDLNILDKWIMVSDDLPFRYRRGPNNAVVINNTAYILANEKNNYTDDAQYLWKFDIVNYNWKKINTAVPKYDIFSSGIVETVGKYIYYYTANSLNEFWRYSTVDNIWERLGDFPGKRRDYSAHFTIGSDIYIGIGTDLKPYNVIDYVDFYKYSTVTNKWTQISDIPFDIWGGNRRMDMTSFVINNIGYLAGGAYGTGDADAWSYTPNNNSWKQIADFPMANHESVAFEMNGLGYVTGGAEVGGSRLNKSWVYSPDNNSWQESDDIIEGRGWHFSFVIGNRAYIGGGDNYSGGSGLDNFYEYIP